MKERDERAVRWGALLGREMAGARMSDHAVAAALGVRHETVWSWRTGRSFAGIEHALELAFLLSQPSLLTMVQRPRTKACALCGKAFIDVGRFMKARYCSRKCQHTMETRRRREQAEVQDQLTTRRLNHARETLRLFCAACEPDGLCRDAECVIQQRGDSPLPYVRRTAA